MAKKAALKRIKITKHGKLLHRRSGQNHFNAKASRRSQLRRKNLTVLSGTTEKKIRQYL